MLHTIEICNGSMGVMDEDGQVLDAVALKSYRAAKQQLETWASIYRFKVGEAYREVENFFRHIKSEAPSPIPEDRNETLLRDAFRAMDADRAQKIRAAYYKAVEGLQTLAETLEVADAKQPGPASELMIGEHLFACEALEAMKKSLLGRIL